MDRLKSWLLHAKIAGVAVSAVVLFIITAAIAGIIGNRADTLFVLVWGPITSSVNSGWWPLVIILILLIDLSTVILLWKRTKSNLRITHQIVDLDYKLLRLVPNLVSASDEEFKKSAQNRQQAAQILP